MSGDFDFEPVRGLPQRLPAGEHILWQGAPEWTALAVRTFHIRKVALYFAFLLAWRGVSAVANGDRIVDALWSWLRLSPIALAAMGMIALLAYLAARTTVYTITSRRLVLRIGIAVPMTINLPFAVIERAALKVHKDGSGEIPIATGGKDRFAYLILWPHVRPWRIAHPEPMLRSVPNAAAVAATLARAVSASTAQPVAMAAETSSAGSEPQARPLVTATA
jgi:hypothetical protein